VSGRAGIVIGYKFGNLIMGCGVKLGVFSAVTLVFFAPISASWAAKVSPIIDERLKNIELCNQSDPQAIDSRIQGCTALINSRRKEPTLVLAIAHNNRGNAYSEKGDYDHAIQDYDSAIQLNPNYAQPYNNRGVVYQKKGDYDQAIKDFDEAIKLNPDYAYAFANRAETYQIKHDYQRAVRDYGDALRADPNFKAIWNGRCWARAVIGQLQDALTDCNNALGAQPNAVTYDSRGLVYLKLGQYHSAIDDYDSALRLEPKLASAFYGRGLAKLKTGDKTGGEADIAAAKALNATIAAEFSRYGIQ
jgi:tetratricopeptide (TPR) repeat protein